MPRSRSDERDPEAVLRLQSLRLTAAAPGWVPRQEQPPRPVATHLSPVATSTEMTSPATTALPEPEQPPASAPPARIVHPTAGPLHPRPPAPVPTLSSLLRGWCADRLPLSLRGLAQIGGRAMVAVLAIVVAIGIGAVLLLQHRSAGGSSYPPSSGSSYDDPTAAAASGPTAQGYPGAGSVDGGSGSEGSTTGVVDGESIVVDVAGKVHKPGLVTLPAGSRVADAIAAAGGPLHPRDVATVDLAAKVGDGQLLVVGPPAAGSSPAGTVPDTATGTSGPVDLNSASLIELETLPGVGPVTAQKILDWRTAHGSFSSVAQLQQVSGIGPARYATLSPLVTT